MNTMAVGSATVSYPATWVVTKQANHLFSAANVANGTSAEEIILSELPASQFLTRPAPPPWQIGRSSRLRHGGRFSVGPVSEGTRILFIAPSTVQGRPPADLTYVYLTDSSILGGNSALPSIREATDTLVASGGNYQILTYSALSATFGDRQAERRTS